MTMQIRKSNERGHANRGWLDSYHSFSFGDYYDPKHMGFSVLRVINEDVIAPSMGFGMHGHRDMEIITYMLAGQLRHKDSMGNGSVIKAGDVQRMSAGTGVMHSEFNASDAEAAHLLQIWLLPNQAGITPSYEEKHIPTERKLNQWCLIASNVPQEEAMLIHQDVQMFSSILEKGHALSYNTQGERDLYLHVASGELVVNGANLSSGDALKVASGTQLTLLANEEAEVVLFDMPAIAKQAEYLD